MVVISTSALSILYLVAYYNLVTNFSFDLTSLHHLELPHLSKLLCFPRLFELCALQVMMYM
jgi:hypothetical protein